MRNLINNSGWAFDGQGIRHYFSRSRESVCGHTTIRPPTNVSNGTLADVPHKTDCDKCRDYRNNELKSRWLMFGQELIGIFSIKGNKNERTF